MYNVRAACVCLCESVCVRVCRVEGERVTVIMTNGSSRVLSPHSTELYSGQHAIIAQRPGLPVIYALCEEDANALTPH